MDMCTENGALERYIIILWRRVIGKSSGKEGGYFESKHLHGGDLWRFPKQAPKKVGKKRTRKLTTIVWYVYKNGYILFHNIALKDSIVPKTIAKIATTKTKIYVNVG